MNQEAERKDFERWLKENEPATYRLAFEWDEEEDEVINSAKASVLDMRTGWMGRAELAASLHAEIERLNRVCESRKTAMLFWYGRFKDRAELEKSDGKVN